MNYQSVLKRIEEIIVLSKELLASVDVEKNEFISIRHFRIHKDYAKEFKDLLDTEKTFFLLNKNENASENNDKLLEYCKKQIDIDTIYFEEYNIIIEILNECYRKNANELVEFFGYYILKNRLEEFVDACRVIKIGPCIRLKELSREEAIRRINESLKINKEQYKRIEKYLAKENEESSIKVVSDIDELVEYFSYRNDLNVDALKLLIPSIGIINFHYLIDNLLRNGTISIEDYKKHLNEFNLISSEQKK